MEKASYITSSEFLKSCISAFLCLEKRYEPQCECPFFAKRTVPQISHNVFVQKQPFNKTRLLPVILAFVLLQIISYLLGCGDAGTNNRGKTTENKMYVYSNQGNTFYLLDYKTFEVVEEIYLNVPDSVTCNAMTLSMNNDHLFFKALTPYPNASLGFAVYNIGENKLKNIFFTQFHNAEPAYFVSSQNPTTPGLIYVVLRDYGTFSMDLFGQRLVEQISTEHNFNLDKRIYHSPDGKWQVVHKKWSGDITGSFSELWFYSVSSGLHDVQFILNGGDKDSISIYAFKFSNDNKLYISYQLSNGRSRDIESYFGAYDLETKKLHRSSLKFSWSLSGYDVGYSANRKEIYTVGNDGQFYVISSETWSVLDTINIPVRGEQSPISIAPGENAAFVCYPSSNSIFVIDLNVRRVIKVIFLPHPYNIIIP